MRKNLTLSIIFILSTFISLGQSLMTNYEIWGYNGTTEEFVEKYKKKFDVDLRQSHSCMAQLKEMGYSHSLSIVYDNNQANMFIRSADTDMVDRLTIVRQISNNKYTKMAFDKSWLASAKNIYSDIELKDIATTTQLMAKNNSQLRDLLIGTLISNENMDLRVECCELLNLKIDFSKINLTSAEFGIIGAMLSFPDPKTCYCAMKIISKSKIKSKEIFCEEGAETLKDFLRSNLFTFKTDAKNFLIEFEPKGKNWSSNEWIKWIDSQRG